MESSPSNRDEVLRELEYLAQGQHPDQQTPLMRFTRKEKQTMATARAEGYVFKGREVVNTPQGKKVQLRFAVR